MARPGTRTRGPSRPTLCHLRRRPCDPAKSPCPKSTATIDWGDGVVTGATVATDRMGQTVVTADRTLAPATTYDARLTLPDGDSPAGFTVARSRSRRPWPIPNLSPPPTPVFLASRVSPWPRRPSGRIGLRARGAPAGRGLARSAHADFAAPARATTCRRPGHPRAALGPPQPQFEAGAVRASLSAHGEPLVSVTVASPGPPVQVSAVQVTVNCAPGGRHATAVHRLGLRLGGDPAVLGSHGRVRVNMRTAFARPGPRASRPAYDAGLARRGARRTGPVGPDDVLNALAAEPVADAPVLRPAVSRTRIAPAERDSLWQSASS